MIRLKPYYAVYRILYDLLQTSPAILPNISFLLPILTTRYTPAIVNKLLTKAVTAVNHIAKDSSLIPDI